MYRTNIHLKLIFSLCFMFLGAFAFQAQAYTTKTLLEPSGAFNDGSNDLNYENNLDCNWIIQPNGAVNVTVTFSDYNLGVGDVVEVFDGSTASSTLLMRLTSSTQPSGSITSSGGAMLVRFRTDAQGVAAGFSVQYSSTIANCGKATNLKAFDVSKTSSKITWDLVPGALAYEVEVRIPGSPWTRLPRTATNFIEATGLNEGTQYQSWARAVCENGVVSEWSKGVLFTTLGGASQKCNSNVVKLKVEDITSTSAKATWDFEGYTQGNRTQAGRKYELQVRAASRAQGTIGAGWESTFFESNSFTMSNLQPNTVYEAMGRVICEDGDTSNWSSIIPFKTLAATASQGCIPPSTLDAAPIEENGYIFVEVAWGDGPITTSNRIQAANRYEVSFKKSKSVSDETGLVDWVTVVTTGSRLIIPQLSASTKYNFRVRSVCSDVDTSSFSNIIEYTTPPYLGPKFERVCLSSNTRRLAANDEVEVSVTVSNIRNNLRQVRSEINYDTRYLDLVGSTVGDFIPNGVALPLNHNEAAGIIRFGVASNSATNSSSGTLYKFKFKLMPTPPQDVSMPIALVTTTGLDVNNASIELNSCPDLVLDGFSNCSPVAAAPSGNTTICSSGGVVINAILGGTSAGVTYKWQKDMLDIPFATGQSFVATETGNYRVKAQVTGCNETVSNEVAVQVMSGPKVNAVVKNALNSQSSDGSISVSTTNGTSPFIFRLNTMEKTDPAGTIFTNLRPGSYQLNVTDASGCSYTTTLEVTVASNCPSAQINPTGTVSICGTGGINLTATTGTNLVYRWYRNNSLIAGADRAAYYATMPGSYYVEISATNCNSRSENTIVNQADLGVLTQIRSSSSASSMDGGVTVQAQGGTAPYTYILGLTTLTSYSDATFNGLAPGTYNIFIQDARGCQASRQITITLAGSTGGTCSVPSGLQVNRLGLNNAEISWNNSSATQCYIIAFGPLSIADSYWAQYTVTNPNTSFVLTGLTSGNYGAKIRSNCDLCSIRTGNRSDWSGTVPLSITREMGMGSATGISIYPNPNNGIFQIRFDSNLDAPAQINIFDATGRLVVSEAYNNENDTNLYPVQLADPGMYVIKINQGSQTFTQKILVR